MTNVPTALRWRIGRWHRFTGGMSTGLPDRRAATADTRFHIRWRTVRHGTLSVSEGDRLSRTRSRNACVQTQRLGRDNNEFINESGI